MSDQCRRELDRRWKETGSPEDEAALLLNRARAGDLSREQLKLAAYLEHPAAGLALNQLDEPTPEAPEGAQEWYKHLRQFGNEAALRCLIASIRGLNSKFLHEYGDESSEFSSTYRCICRRYSEEVSWIEKHLVFPSEEMSNQWAQRAQRNQGMTSENRDILTRILRTSSDDCHEAWDLKMTFTLERAVYLLRDAEPEIPGDIHIDMAAIREEVIPWALGHSDPVRERVEARQNEQVIAGTQEPRGNIRDVLEH